MLDQKLKVVHEYCIHCGQCVMRGFADARDGKKYIKADLKPVDFPQAIGCCPVGAIVEVEDSSSMENKDSELPIKLS